MKIGAGAILLCLILAACIYAQRWSFAVLGDSRGGGTTFRAALREARDLKANPPPSVGPPRFLIVTGDFGRPVARYRHYRRIFAGQSHTRAFFPLKGNHDVRRDARDIVRRILHHQDSVTLRDARYANYCVDWDNVRLIMIDQYSDLGAEGCVNHAGSMWVEQQIESALRSDHVFIFMHEPAFPRHRHLDNSFNACEDDRDAFWDMLVRNRAKVRAVFSSHTHQYCRMRIADPRSQAAQDSLAFPDEQCGVYQIDCGATGSGRRNTVVRIQVDGLRVQFQVVDAQRGSRKPFRLIDQWTIAPTEDGSADTP